MSRVHWVLDHCCTWRLYVLSLRPEKQNIENLRSLRSSFFFLHLSFFKREPKKNEKADGWRKPFLDSRSHPVFPIHMHILQVHIPHQRRLNKLTSTFIHFQRKLQAHVFFGGQIKKLWIWEILLMVQKSGFHQLSLVIYPMIYEALHIPYTIHPSWCRISSSNRMI